MKRLSRGTATQPTALIHHVREIQLRLLATVAVLLGGMVAGYFFYEPLFAFIKAPLDAPLHYMSPAGSFTFIIKICLVVGIVAALPVAVYNVIMFVQPALSKQLSRLRVYVTTLASLALAGGGAAFGYFVILPLSLRFFYKFQVEGLEAIISADEYLRFVIGVIVTFVLIFQLPLLMSLADHIRPLPPRKLLKAEKYIIVGSVFIGVIVPFALDPAIQLLIASPIIVLYNLSIVLVLAQQFFRKRRGKSKKRSDPRTEPEKTYISPGIPLVPEPEPAPVPVIADPAPEPMPPTTSHPRSVDGMLRTSRPVRTLVPERPQLHPAPRATTPPKKPLAMDIHPIPAQRRPSITIPSSATN